MEDYRKMMKNISNNGESSSSQRPSCQCNCHRRQASFPPGYKFNPTDEELVINYLKKKVMNDPLPCTEIMSVKIPEVNLYRYNPEDLAAGYNLGSGEKNWYFFTPRDRKYPNGFRPNRAAGDGFWKATGADKWVMSDNDIVGYRKALVFYQGKPPKGTKTNWIMHEFRYNAPARKRTSSGDMKLDDWVLCRIYKKIESANSKSKEGKTTAETQIETPEFDETQIETPAFDETQIDQGGNTSTDNEPLSEEDDLERFLNHVGQEQQQHLSPPVPPFQGESLANHAQYLRKFEQDQDYYVPVPANETTNYGFQHQQQHEQRPPPQMVQQPVHVVSRPSMRPNQIPIIRAKQMTRHYPMEPQQQQNIPHQWTEEDLDQYFRLEQYWLQQQNNEEFGYSESLRAYFTDDGRYLEDVKDLNRHLSKDGDNNPPGGYPHNPHSNP